MRGLVMLLVLLLIALLTVGIALALPLGLGPDEPPHLQYAGYIADHGLPVPGSTSSSSAGNGSTAAKRACP